MKNTYDSIPFDNCPALDGYHCQTNSIVDAILMTLTVAGIRPVVSMLPEALKVYDEV